MKYKTLGELYDALQRIEHCDTVIARCEQHIRHGGAPDTMILKHARLADAIRRKDMVRDESLSEADEFVHNFFDASWG